MNDIRGTGDEHPHRNQIGPNSIGFSPHTMSFVEELRAITGAESVRLQPMELMAYAYDATGEKHLPDAVVFPATAEQVASCLRVAQAHCVPVVARGAATNLSGGTLPTQGGMVLNLVRMNRICRIDPVRRYAVVEPGVVNQSLNDALGPLGFHFAPDPSSRKVATVGGNIGENAGGPHCLKYGVTTGHVLSVQLALAGGELTELSEDDAYDLRGLVIGSEGTLGVVTRAKVRITPLPAAVRTILAVFADLDAACRTVSQIIAARIIPAAAELMDGQMLELTRESGFSAFPVGAEAALILEVDGDPEDLNEETDQIRTICQEMGAVQIRSAVEGTERDAIWQGRRAAYGVMARASPSVLTQDVTVPRDRLPEMLRTVLEIGRRHGVRILTVAHAGDGNMHPTMPFDPRNPADLDRVRQADLEILSACIRMGGSISGEHGIGIEKLEGMNLMIPPEQLALMRRVRTVFDPGGQMNPGKLIPSPKGGY